MAHKKPLSERQQRMLEFISQFSGVHGYPPTIRDIGAELGISSTSVVSYNLKILEKEGLIERAETVSRGLKVLHSGAEEEFNGKSAFRPTVQIPVLGTIAAGQPLHYPDSSSYSTGEWLELTKDLVPDTREIYALRVKGDSMIDALVNDGDLVILRKQERVENGQMAAVWMTEEGALDGETTLKYVYLEGSRVKLKPANPTMQPWYVPAENVRVMGKVIAVIRQIQ